MEWIGVVAFIGVIYGAVVLWEKLKEQESESGRAARGVSSAMGSAGRGLVRVYGVALVAGGVFVVVVAGGSAGVILAALAMAGYGFYLVFGGSWVIY